MHTDWVSHCLTQFWHSRLRVSADPTGLVPGDWASDARCKLKLFPALSITGCKLMVPTVPSLGFSGLVEQLIELRKTLSRFIIAKGYQTRTAKWRDIWGTIWEGSKCKALVSSGCVTVLGHWYTQSEFLLGFHSIAMWWGHWPWDWTQSPLSFTRGKWGWYYLVHSPSPLITWLALLTWPAPS